MIYGSTTLATDFVSDSWKEKLLRVLLFFIPRGSPDHEKLYPLVRKWYLEIDETGDPVREIGLDAEGRPLFGAPDDRNLGFWTDSPKEFQPSELYSMLAEEFEKLWQAVQRGRENCT